MKKTLLGVEAVLLRHFLRFESVKRGKRELQLKLVNDLMEKGYLMVQTDFDHGDVSMSYLVTEEGKKALEEWALCMDCQKPFGDYMVTNEVWKEAVPERQGFMCIVCLQARLKRPLTRADFKNVPSNQAIFFVLDHIKG